MLSSLSSRRNLVTQEDGHAYRTRNTWPAGADGESGNPTTASGQTLSPGVPDPPHPGRGGQLDRYVPAIAAKARAIFDTHRGDAEEPSELIIDLSHAAELPQSQLILLVTLLRRIVGDGPTITLSGVRPMILGSLVGFGLPDDVVVVDTRGREWSSAQ